MKIALGMYYHEANSFNPYLNQKSSFVYAEGQEALDRMFAAETFRAVNAELVPLIYAVSLPNAIMERDSYEFFTNRILSILKEHGDLDGIFLHLHGSMEVDGLGSGEFDLLTRIRGVVGGRVVIGVAMDIHANNDPRTAGLVNVMRGYRTVPHVDQEETEKAVASHMLKCIRENIRTVPQFVRLPYAIHAEKALGNAWPLKEIFETLGDMEKEEGIAVATLFIGMLWCDCPTLATNVAVTPTEEKYTRKAKEAAQKLADYVYSFRDSFEFEQLPLSPHEAVRYAFRFDGAPVYVSDSGDNTTGGAVGDYTLLLREFLNCRDYRGKKALVTGIWDAKAVEQCEKYNEGDKISLSVGTGRDEHSSPVHVEGVLKKKGNLLGYMGCGEDVIGKTMTISAANVNLDFAVMDRPGSFISLAHFKAAGLNLEDYQVVAVKQGYLFAELSKAAKLAILALTPGATHQVIENLRYTKIIHPLYPFVQ